MSVPPSVGDVLAGECPEIEHDGKTWKIGHPKQSAKDRLEKLVIRDTWENVEAAKIGVPEFDNEQSKAFQESIRNREYRTGGKMWAAAFSRVQGQILFYLALIQEHHPKATVQDVIELMAAKPDEFLNAIEIVTPRFFFVAAEAMDLPPEKARQWATAQAEAFLTALQAARQSQTTPSS